MVTGGARATYERLRDAILTREIEEGRPLVEAQLAERFSVSRTPIREALTRLEQDGLLERRDRGLVVRTRSPEEILDIYETRIVLEGKAAATAADRRTDMNLRRLRKLIDRGRVLGPADGVLLMTNNQDFHRAVWHAARNESLTDLLERLNLHLARYPTTTLSYEGRWERALEQHAALVDALEARDAREAESIAEQHFSEARDIRLHLWEGQFGSVRNLAHTPPLTFS